MKLVVLDSDASAAPLTRGEPAVCIPVFGAVDLFAQCIRSVLRWTPAHVPILVADDATPDPDVLRILEELAPVAEHGHTVYYLRQPSNVGFVANVNAAFAVLSPADVIVLNSDCIVAQDWFDRLGAAARSNTRVATVSTLTNHGTILSVPFRNRPQAALPQELSLSDAAASVARSARRSRPEIPTTVGHCMYIRRAALDLVGGFDLAFSPGYGEEVDFAQRCLARGFSHIVADDVLVLHQGGASFQPGGGLNATQVAHHDIISSRYRYYDEMVDAVAADERSPLAQALATAGTALRGTSVTIDARSLGPLLTGTQLHTLEVIAAVHATGRVNLRVVLPAETGDYATTMLARMPEVEVIRSGSSEPLDVGVTDVVHRPHQITSARDLEFLASLGRRMVITHQDFIGFHNPDYFATFDEWSDHRRLTREALDAADAVVFFSQHAAEEAIGADLVGPEQSRVIYIGTDHRLNELQPVAAAPSGVGHLEDRPFLLCIGTDFKHKNRPFALRVLRALREHQGWEGALVFAGPHVIKGSSAGDEARYLAANPGLEDHVVDLPAVDEAGKAWLMAHADAVIYPSTYEGFGLVPYEAAAAGVPCLFAAQTSVAELLPESLATIVMWDAKETAARSLPLLVPGPERDAHVAAIRVASSRLTWSNTAAALVDTYADAARRPARGATRLVLQRYADVRELEELHADRERLEEELEAQTSHADRLQHRLNQKLDRLNHIDRALVEPGGVIPEHLKRPLLAVATRPVLRALFFGPVRVVYRIGRRGRPPELPERASEEHVA